MQDAGSNGIVAAGSQCISLWHSENFAILAKLRIFARPGHFRYALFLAKKHIFATHINFAKLAKFR